jgi:DNA-binding response OmpR family regulator
MSHILVVEDEPRMSQTLEKGLRKANFEVTIIVNGLIARNLDLDGFDLILLDWNLPGVSGLELLRYWRGKRVEIPIIMLTARDGLSDRVEGLDWGADDYISKFFEWEELIARIRALLRRVSKSAETVGTIVFDRVNSCFLENQNIIALTSTEYIILKYFFDNRNRIITRHNLINAVYGKEESPYSNVIERHIKSIRSKFNYDPIKTFRNMGYRLRPDSPIT